MLIVSFLVVVKSRVFAVVSGPGRVLLNEKSWRHDQKATIAAVVGFLVAVIGFLAAVIGFLAAVIVECLWFAGPPVRASGCVCSSFGSARA